VLSNVFFGLVRRDALAKTRLHSAYPSADFVLLAELALLGRFLMLPERLFYRRVHPGMSRVAHRGLGAVAEWFEPGTSRTVRPELWRLFAEHLGAIRRAPIGVGERTRITCPFVPVWVARHKRGMANEFWRAARTHAHAPKPKPSAG